MGRHPSRTDYCRLFGDRLAHFRIWNHPTVDPLLLGPTDAVHEDAGLDIRYPFEECLSLLAFPKRSSDYAFACDFWKMASLDVVPRDEKVQQRLLTQLWALTIETQT